MKNAQHDEGRSIREFNKADKADGEETVVIDKEISAIK